MATPQSVNSQSDATGDKKLEQITFRFCSECSNMLYPKEDEDSHKLQFTCRTCQYTEEAASTCVFRNVMNNSAGETAGVTQDVGSDPTVSHTLPISCLTCGTIIICDFCHQPTPHLTLAKRGDVSVAAKMGNLEFIQAMTGGTNVEPFAEYDGVSESEIDQEPQAAGAAILDEGYAVADPTACTAAKLLASLHNTVSRDADTITTHVGGTSYAIRSMVVRL